MAFGLALLGRSPRTSVVFGALALAALLAGYVVGSELRNFTASSSLVLFWGAAALLIGPLLGLAASWLRAGRGTLAALGTGAISGVLVGEGVYGVIDLSGTTSVGYWWCEIAVGVAVLASVAAGRLRGSRAVAVALLVAGVTAGLFVLIYRQDLISVLP